MVNMELAGTYYAAVIENRADFLGRIVVDVGAGSGILSLFAAQVIFCINAFLMDDINLGTASYSNIYQVSFLFLASLHIQKNPS